MPRVMDGIGYRIILYVRKIRIRSCHEWTTYITEFKDSHSMVSQQYNTSNL